MPEVQTIIKINIRQHLEELSIDTNDNKLKKVFEIRTGFFLILYFSLNNFLIPFVLAGCFVANRTVWHRES